MWLYLCGVERVPPKSDPSRQGGIGGAFHRASPDTVSFVKRHGVVFPQNSVKSAAQYYDTFGDKWRAQSGAVDWARERGAQPFADATDTSGDSKSGRKLSMDLPTGIASISYFNDDDDDDDSDNDDGGGGDEEERPIRSSGAVPSVDPEAAKRSAAALSASVMEAPSADKVCCSACGTVALDLKACRCKAVRYCGKACQVDDWPRHKLACTWKSSNKKG